MKPGDLIKLVSGANLNKVLLGQFDPFFHENWVPIGTVAVFMGSMPPSMPDGFTKRDRSQILVNGTINWVYYNEYEPL